MCVRFHCRLGQRVPYSPILVEYPDKVNGTSTAGILRLMSSQGLWVWRVWPSWTGQVHITFTKSSSRVYMADIVIRLVSHLRGRDGGRGERERGRQGGREGAG